jgi:DnaJ-class molecular chaperone
MEQQQHTRLYAVLELVPSATREDVKKAFRQLSLRWHPDKHPEERREQATERFREIAEAYEVLCDGELLLLLLLLLRDGRFLCIVHLLKR